MTGGVTILEESIFTAAKVYKIFFSNWFENTRSNIEYKKPVFISHEKKTKTNCKKGNDYLTASYLVKLFKSFGIFLQHHTFKSFKTSISFDNFK